MSSSLRLRNSLKSGSLKVELQNEWADGARLDWLYDRPREK
jgi:hypothetical protein